MEEVSGEEGQELFHYSSLTVRYRADKKVLMVLHTTLTDNESLHPKHNKNNKDKKKQKVVRKRLGNVQVCKCDCVRMFLTGAQ